jgi:NADH-quinone oxidoreductase subunit G
VGAITQFNDVDKLKQAMALKKEIIGLVAPATRFAIGEPFGFPGVNSSSGLISILKSKFGFSKVYDVNFGADETTLIDTEELLHAMKEGYPMFTSCCPAWIRLAETKYPQLLKNISTAKSCVEMVGHMARKHSPDAFLVELMPCTAKKHELTKHNDIDCCLTVAELVQLFKENNITNTDFLPNIKFDEPFGVVSGGSYIFGRTGGVGENVLRQACLLKGVAAYKVEKEWEEEGLKFKQCQIGDLKVTLCVANGGKQIDKAAQMVLEGTMKADVVEQMACPEGC